MADDVVTDETITSDARAEQAKAALNVLQDHMKKLMGELETDFDPNSQGFRDRTDAAFRNAREAIKDPHVLALIDLSMNMDSKTEEEIQKIGRDMRAAQRLESETALR